MSTTAAAPTETSYDFTGSDIKKLGQRYIVEGRSNNSGFWLAKSTRAKLGEKPIEVSEKELHSRLKGKMRNRQGAPLHQMSRTPGFLS